MQLKVKLTGEKVKAPESLVKEYPELANIVDIDNEGENLSLFWINPKLLKFVLDIPIIFLYNKGEQLFTFIVLVSEVA